MRLIDLDRLKEEMCNWCEHKDECGFECDECYDMFVIERCPTVDAEPVVRCKDCKHFQPFRKHDGFCKIDSTLWDNDWFCAGGERR